MVSNKATIGFVCNLWVHFHRVKVIGAHVEIRGGMHFSDNDGGGIDGGAVYVTSLGQLELFRGANITFTGNTGM